MKILLLSILFIAPNLVAMENILTIKHAEQHTKLMNACSQGFLEEARSLLDNALINVADLEGWTPLIKASAEGHIHIVKALLDAGAKWDARTKQGNTALVMASCNMHPEVVSVLAPIATLQDKKDAYEWVTFFNKQNWLNTETPKKFAIITQILQNAGV